MESKAKFTPPELSYIPRRVFEEELQRLLPEVASDMVGREACWHRFCGFSMMAFMDEPAFEMMNEDDYRKIAWGWLVRERSVRISEASKREFDAATKVIDGLMAQIRQKEIKKGNCLMPDLQHGCLRKHDCEAEQDHGDEDMEVTSGPAGMPKQLLELLKSFGLDPNKGRAIAIDISPKMSAAKKEDKKPN